MSKLIIYTKDNINFELDGTGKYISSRYEPDYGDTTPTEKRNITVTKHFEAADAYVPDLKIFADKLEGHEIIKVEWIANENILTFIEGNIRYNWFLYESPELQEVLTFVLN